MRKLSYNDKLRKRLNQSEHTTKCFGGTFLNTLYIHIHLLLHTAFTLCAEWHIMNYEVITVSVRLAITYICTFYKYKTL